MTKPVHHFQQASRGIRTTVIMNNISSARFFFFGERAFGSREPQERCWKAFLGSGSSILHPSILTKVVDTSAQQGCAKAGGTLQEGCAGCAHVPWGSPLTGGAPGVNQFQLRSHETLVRSGAGPAWRASHSVCWPRLLLCFELTLLEIPGFAPKLSVWNRHQQQNS